MRHILALLFCVLVATTCSWAGGETVFLKTCGSCHRPGGTAPPVNPTDKAGIVWKKYFKRKRHPVDISSISPGEMKAVLRYLEEHAADSDHPEAAVIPK